MLYSEMSKVNKRNPVRIGRVNVFLVIFKVFSDNRQRTFNLVFYRTPGIARSHVVRVKSVKSLLETADGGVY